MRKTPIKPVTKLTDKLPEDQRIILDLAQGSRTPRNDDEAEMLKEIQEIEAKGYMIDLPFD